jgi:hypothetical protein
MAELFTLEQHAAYERDGFVLIRSLFDTEKIALLRGAIETDPQLHVSFRFGTKRRHDRTACSCTPLIFRCQRCGACRAQITMESTG